MTDGSPIQQRCATLVELLRARAAATPDRTGYTFLHDGETDARSLTYGELDAQARAVAAQLQAHCGPGERVLLFYPPGLDYIAGLLGCLYAGMVAVPAYPPNPARLERTLPRLRTLARDAEPAVILTSAGLQGIAGPLAAEDAVFGRAAWLAPTHDADAAAWRPAPLDGESLAVLQYTSGSTASPKGVMLSHGNMLHNLAAIAACFGHSEESRGVIWLPPYHDMGLIGGILQPLYAGFPVALMSPSAFLQRPARWLEAIARFRATTSGGPNSAYELCIQKTTPEQRARLDLSSWRVAFNGAEPVRAETLERFADAFAASGFRRTAFYPCYGLAEATLIVAGGTAGREPAVVPAAELVSPTGVHSPDPQTRLVGCGQSIGGQHIAIVDPAEQTRCADGTPGEIWVSGPCVAQGYWGQPDLTADTFRARIRNGPEAAFLRTGDLGVVRENELFVLGRLKDLIIIRGRNLYPQDIEQTVEQSHAALRPSCGAAFGVDIEGEERLVIVQEVSRHHRHGALDGITDAIRQAVVLQHEVQPHAVVLIREGSMVKTSSGKVQRYACRAAFLAQTLPVLQTSTIPERPAGSAIEDIREQLAAASPAERPALVGTYLATVIGDLTGAAVGASEARANTLALDSLTAVEFQHRVETDLGRAVPMTAFLEAPDLGDLAARILDAPPAVEQPALPEALEITIPLTHGQRAIWFLHHLAPESTAYSIASAVRIAGSLDPGALATAFDALTMRHESLRMTFAVVDGEPFQTVQPWSSARVRAEDAAGWDDAQLRAAIEAEAGRPFDLTGEPLLRATVWTRSAEQHVLLLVIHHLLADFWSIAVMLKELGELYGAARDGRAPTLPPPRTTYSAAAQQQAALLAGPAGDRLWGYWQDQLVGELPILDLPTDFPRPAIQRYDGAACTIALDQQLTRRLAARSQEQGATLYTTLLAAFGVLLGWYSGQDEVVIGSPTAARSRAELATLVGYLINPLPLRIRLAQAGSFTELLDQVRHSVLGAFAHQDLPFPLLAERLHPLRDASRSPIFQAMLIHQQSPHQSDPALAGFAVGDEQARMGWAGHELAPYPLAQRTAQFDLTLLTAESGGRLHASLQYASALFEEGTVRRMLRHFALLLEQIAAGPERPLRALLRLGEEDAQLLRNWNARSATKEAAGGCMHSGFEQQALRTPEATALIFEGTALSYGQLDAAANQIARRLRRAHVGPDVRVGVFLDRSAELVSALLGILKAGGAYVPLDPTYPQERLRFMIADAGIAVLITQQRYSGLLAGSGVPLICLDNERALLAAESPAPPPPLADPEHLAYVIYTSGSTGRPKGVMIRHSSAVNFFEGMDRRIGCGPDDTLLAVTSISFDISVLEIFWTLSRGARVVLLPEHAIGARAPAQARTERPVSFSLFYFASNDQDQAEAYRLLLEGTTFADQHGFEAVWTPERHFHAFGGLYPNPSVTGAALAVLTKQIQIRAGSVVLPLHHSLRVAEEWALVDNLSRGRVGLAFASGWHADDFAFFPERFPDRKAHMVAEIETVRRLWRGEAVAVRGGAGNTIDVRIYPRPVQAELPVWITAAGEVATFERAGALGTNVLTHLLGQSIDNVAEKIRSYRQARAAAGHDPSTGRVTLMLHTLLGDDAEAVREQVRVPFTNYLRSSVGLIEQLIKSLQLPLDLASMSPSDMDDLLAHAFRRYVETSALFGTPETCLPLVERLQAIGVDEIACLIDFGVSTDVALEGLRHLDRLRAQVCQPGEQPDYSLAAQAERYQPTLLQCTPSLMSMLALDERAIGALQSLRVLMLGGEPLPPALARRVQQLLPGRLVNMYGPTETTIWSTTHEVGPLAPEERTVPIGTPIANTPIAILDGSLRPLPVGAVGDLYIGGAGLARGYLGRPELTAERFVPDPSVPGARMYKTGDRARLQADGTLVFVGRQDHQIKLRGFRIELEEVEAVLARHSGVREVVAVVRTLAANDTRLLAYIVPHIPPAGEGDAEELLAALRQLAHEHLPASMVPSQIVALPALPHTANGKIDRALLPVPQVARAETQRSYIPPESVLEQAIAGIWRDVLGVEQVGVSDSFFDLGGHSLLMAQVHSRLRTELQIDIPLIKLLEHPMISSLAAYVSRQQSETPSFQPSVERARRQLESRRRPRPTPRGES
ncbi:MAG TPA: MupA/Atu3671 family FMN-dependent luciferase-like monooxygenase [Roseiflexaceae bacterium]|nr:MupA/Atu3671 family FMN-dependent luciferase-like monooxygenase [Roseiflexaceae bacterium]